jgi:hypothetical protein
MSSDNERSDLSPGAADWWTVDQGESPVVGTAIHNGHRLPAEAGRRMSLAPGDRLREEDPHTAHFIRDLPNRIVVHRSRFALDLNRARGEAVYLAPEQSWGLEVWKERPEQPMIERALHMHDQYYAMLQTMLRGVEQEHGRFVVLDVHSYNHRRDGPDAAPGPPEAMPDINIGTYSMDRRRWAHVVEPFMEGLRTLRFRGRQLDVRENVAFQGRGEQTRFIHATFPETGCAIALEVKKIFMNEWTGEPDPAALDEVRNLVRATLPLLERVIRKAP